MIPNLLAMTDLSLWAYLDPGVGHIVIQALMAFAVGAALTFRHALVFPFRWARAKLSGSNSGSVSSGDYNSGKPDGRGN